MISAIVIVFREVLEASLVVGIVLAATRGLVGAARWVALGIFGGLAGAGVIARFASVIADALAGFGQEIFNASVLLLAVAMLAWHNVWMSAHGREIAKKMRGVGAAVMEGQRPLYALGLVVGLAVLREGAETVLFLYGLAASDGGLVTAVTGGAVGILIGIAVGATLYFGLLRIPARHLFSVTTWMITLLAAGMAAQATAFLGAAGLLPLGKALWDTSWLLDQNSLVGKVLHALVGYMDRPTPAQLIAYFCTLVLIVAATSVTTRRANKTEDARG